MAPKPNNSDDQAQKNADVAADEGSSQLPENVETSRDISQTRDSESKQAIKKKDVSGSHNEVPIDFGRYRIEHELGRGGMGVVYLAHDSQLDRKVALKIPSFSDNDSIAVERFYREARAMATVQHANLCPIYDVGKFDQWHFLTMAFIDGQSLASKLKQSPLSFFRALQIVKTVALALQKAHDAGIVHRDLKPSNIMINGEDEPIIMDFGLARRESAIEVELTQSRAILGSPSYMAPEQVEARHDDVGPATDIYALGVILYQLVTGQKPFQGSVASVFGQIVTRNPDPPSALHTQLPKSIDAICLKALAKSTTDRYTSAAEFADALMPVLADTENIAPTRIQEIDSQFAPVNTAASSEFISDDVSSSRRSRAAERRQLTVMICNCDADDPEQSLASFDPEDQRDVLELFRNVCEGVTQRFGGTVVHSTGQELLLCFGYPTAFEDAPHRAIRTGMGILEEIKQQNKNLQEQGKTTLSAWMAIHTGMVVAGESSVSESQVDTLSIVGEARTVASRLEALTEPEQIIISDATHRLVEGFFVCESQGTQKIRGVAQPVELFQVIKESVAHSRVELADPANLTPLVGRDMELGIIKDRWEHAEEGMGQVVLLIGEAGLGKSRLVREIKEHVLTDVPDAGARVIEWRCSAYHEGSRLYPVIGFFERLFDFTRDVSPQERLDKLVNHLTALNLGQPEQVAIFASLLSIPPDMRCAPLELTPIRQKERTQELLLEWLREYSSAQPVLFIVEDLHWVDPSTLEYLALHVDQGLHDNVLTLLSFRPEFRTPWQSYSHMTQVALTKLTKRQIGEMVKRKTGVENIPAAIIAKLAERTDGVPLFVEEFTQMVQESGVLDADRKGDDITEALSSIPVTLQDLLTARLDRLDSDPDIVQLGATFGREFSYELISAASDLEEQELQSELAKLTEAELLFQKGRPPKSTYIFKHALIQDAAYNSMLKQKRRQFHRQIAETLASEFEQTAATQPELLAHHFTEAGQSEAAVQYWLQAGQLAQQRSANAEAISHLTRGLKVLAGLKESELRDQLELGLQATLFPVLMAARGWSAPEVKTAIERAEILVAKVGALEDQFFVKWGLWGWRIIRADMDICSGIANDILQLVETSAAGSDLLPEAYWCVGASAYYKGDFKDGLNLLEKGLTLIDDDRERVYALKTGQFCSVLLRSHIALALWQLGFPDQALQKTDEMIKRAIQINHPFSYAMGLFFRRQILEFSGLEEQALEVIEEEYKVCNENGFVFFEVHAIFGRGVSLLRQGKVDEANKQFGQGLEMLHATGGNLSMDFPYRNIAEAYLAAGMLDDANQWLERGFDLVDNHMERGMESEFLRLRGEVALASDDQKFAEECFRQAVEVAGQQQAKSWELRAMISFANLKRRQGKLSEARQMLESTFGFFTEGLDSADLIRAKSLLDELGAES